MRKKIRRLKSKLKKRKKKVVPPIVETIPLTPQLATFCSMSGLGPRVTMRLVDQTEEYYILEPLEGGNVTIQRKEEYRVETVSFFSPIRQE